MFQNVTAIPMDRDKIAQGQTVVIRGALIEAVGPTASIRVPPGAVVIDGTGRFLVPGLTDMHVHLPGPAAPAGRAEDELFLYVATGVTTVRNMAGSDNHLLLRERIKRRKTARAHTDSGLTSPGDGVRQVREQKLRGYDLVKILPGLACRPMTRSSKPLGK